MELWRIHSERRILEDGTSFEFKKKKSEVSQNLSPFPAVLAIATNYFCIFYLFVWFTKRAVYVSIAFVFVSVTGFFVHPHRVGKSTDKYPGKGYSFGYIPVPDTSVTLLYTRRNNTRGMGKHLSTYPNTFCTFCATSPTYPIFSVSSVALPKPYPILLWVLWHFQNPTENFCSFCITGGTIPGVWVNISQHTRTLPVRSVRHLPQTRYFLWVLWHFRNPTRYFCEFCGTSETLPRTHKPYRTHPCKVPRVTSWWHPATITTSDSKSRQTCARQIMM